MVILDAVRSFSTDPQYRYRAVNWLRGRLGLYGRTSFSQAGEDMVLRSVFDFLRIPKPFYLDIGANHPRHLSNTFFFYRTGSRGVCVEPDPSLARRIRSWRPRDLVLNVGVGPLAAELDFYVMSVSSLNTFSATEAERLVRLGHRVVKTLRVPVMTVSEVLGNCDPTPDLVNIDTEGLDLEIARAIDFSTHRPAAFCVETLTYSEDGHGEKILPLFDLFESKGYFAYADTHVNTIFVDRQRWVRGTSTS